MKIHVLQCSGEQVGHFVAGAWIKRPNERTVKDHFKEHFKGCYDAETDEVTVSYFVLEFEVKDSKNLSP